MQVHATDRPSICVTPQEDADGASCRSIPPREGESSWKAGFVRYDSDGGTDTAHLKSHDLRVDLPYHVEGLLREQVSVARRRSHEK